MMLKIKLIFIEIKNILKWRLRNLVIDPFFILKWELYPKLIRKNSFDKNGNSNLNTPIPVTILTYKRPMYFKKTLESFIEKNKAYLEKFLLIILVQGKTEKDTLDVIEMYKNKIYKIIFLKKNLGCAAGYNLLMNEALKLNSKFVINLQDDFVSNEPVVKYLSELTTCLAKNKTVGYIRLRSIYDKVNNYNIISKRKIKYKANSNHIGIGNGHFTFNPTITKSQIIKAIIPTISEKDAQKKYQKLGLKNGQLFANCFSHIGEKREHEWKK